MMRDEDRCFIDAVQSKRKPFATMADGLAGLRLVSAACESSENDGMPVRI